MMRTIILFFLVVLITGCTRKKAQVEPKCAAEVLTAEQKAYVNYKKAVSKWAYNNSVEIDFDAIDQIYYFPEKHNVDHSGRNKISMYESTE